MKPELLNSLVTFYMDNGGTLNMLSIEPAEKLLGRIPRVLKTKETISVIKWTPDKTAPNTALPNNVEFHINMENVYAVDIGEASIPSESQLVIANEDPRAAAKRLGIMG